MTRSTRYSRARTLSAWLFCWAVALSLLLSSSQPSSAGSRFGGQYDDEIKDAVRKYWGDYPDWLSWKAQLWQESRLDPAAVSPVGARGLAQFMPATWGEVSRQLGIAGASPHVAKYAIQAGAYYMAQLRAQWRAIPFPDRQHLGQASYNAGAGNIRKAQRRCGMASDYTGIAACLPLVTGQANASQTTDYVSRIARWRALMAAGL